MSKKLKIKFWRAEKALAMQILEQEGLPTEKKYDGIVFITSSPELYSEDVYLRGTEKKYDLCICHCYFASNQDRDEYLDKITQAITDELFTGKGDLKVGEMCKVSDNENEDGSPNELIAILPKGYKARFIVKVFYGTGWESFEYAQPLAKRTEPKIEECGELITYTWEEK